MNNNFSLEQCQNLKDHGFPQESSRLYYTDTHTEFGWVLTTKKCRTTEYVACPNLKDVLLETFNPNTTT